VVLYYGTRFKKCFDCAVEVLHKVLSVINQRVVCALCSAGLDGWVGRWLMGEWRVRVRAREWVERTHGKVDSREK
jgi:hypothetical protein